MHMAMQYPRAIENGHGETLTFVRRETVDGVERVVLTGVLQPGETVTFAPGVPHRFWASGDQVLKCEGYVSPPDNVEYFLGKIYESQKENNADDGRPADYDAAFLLGHFRGEYAMPEIPAFVRKAIFPILRSVGRLTGKHRRFDDAPPPISR